MSRLMRGVWLLSAISIMALIVPVHGDVAHLRVTKSDCCAKKPAHHDHCSTPPAKSARAPEQPCCSSCVFNLPLINVPPVTYLFDSSASEEFATLIVNQQSRFVRPPVPPPRV